jgi:hypothetical protein
VTHTIRLFLLAQASIFLVATLVHTGVLLGGFAELAASIAESSIAVILVVGYVLTWIWPARARAIGLTAQALALLGTLIGVFTIVVGVGPRRPIDIAFHVIMLGVLAWGLVSTMRAPAPSLQHP